MARVKIKHSHPRELPSRTKLLGLLADVRISVTRLIPVRDGTVVLTASDKDADNIFSEPLHSNLRDNGYEPLLPPELKALRTILCFRLDDLLIERSKEEMVLEMERQQSWAKVAEVYKFERGNTIKVTFKSAEMARKAKDTGLLLFSLTIPSHQIKMETYTPILACNKCNAIENHSTANCTKPEGFKQCSECAEEGHIYRDCTATTKKCLNCGGPHSARAMRCPIRRAAVKEKEATKRTSTTVPTTTYAAASRPAEGNEMKGFVCLLHAHITNAAEPGTFQQVLSESLKLNNLPDVKLPPNPPSAAILTALTATATSSTRAAEPPHTIAQNSGDPDPDTDDEAETTDTDSSQDGQRRLKICIYKRDSDHWPRGTTYASFREGIVSGRFKLVHNGEPEDTRAVIDHLKQGKLTSYLRSVDDDRYAVLRPAKLPTKRDNQSSRPVTRNGTTQ